MRDIPQYAKNELRPFFIEGQSCVKAVRKARLPIKLRTEVDSFIYRNVLPDCGRVPPNCLKAHMVKTAIQLGLDEHNVSKLKKLFRASLGYEGYYLDEGLLKRV